MVVCVPITQSLHALSSACFVFSQSSIGLGQGNMEDLGIQEVLLEDSRLFCLPPPVMNIPPPPWLDKTHKCSSENCENSPVMTSINSANNIFNNFSVILVTSFSSVIILVAVIILYCR